MYEQPSHGIEGTPRALGRHATVERAGRSIRLVVVEDGAGPLEGKIPLDECEDTVILGQFRGEQPSELERRVVRRIIAFERQGRPIVLALLLVAPRFDAAMTAARLLIARALMAHSAARACCCRALLLTPRNELRDQEREALLKLVDALLGERGSWSLPVRVHFAPAASCPQPGQRMASGLARAAGRPPVFEAVRRMHCSGRG